MKCTVEKPFAALPRLHRLHPHDKARQQQTKEMLCGSTPGNPRAWRRRLPRTLQLMLLRTTDYIGFRGEAREITAGRVAAAPQRGADALKGVQILCRNYLPAKTIKPHRLADGQSKTHRFKSDIWQNIEKTDNRLTLCLDALQ